MAQISPQRLAFIRRKHKNKKVVYCSGVFDLIHPGHVLFLEDCKKYGDILVVAVGSDVNLKKRKGPGRPIMNEKMRLKMVDSIKWVDYCFTSGHKAVNHPLEFQETVFSRLKPNVYIITKDAHGIAYRKDLAKRHKSELVILNRWYPPELGSISTTKLINKIRRLNKPRA